MMKLPTWHVGLIEETVIEPLVTHCNCHPTKLHCGELTHDHLHVM